MLLAPVMRIDVPSTLFGFRFTLDPNASNTLFGFRVTLDAIEAAPTLTSHPSAFCSRSRPFRNLECGRGSSLRKLICLHRHLHRRRSLAVAFYVCARVAGVRQSVRRIAQ